MAFVYCFFGLQLQKKYKKQKLQVFLVFHICLEVEIHKNSKNKSK